MTSPSRTFQPVPETTSFRGRTGRVLYPVERPGPRVSSFIRSAFTDQSATSHSSFAAAQAAILLVPAKLDPLIRSLARPQTAGFVLVYVRTTPAELPVLFWTLRPRSLVVERLVQLPSHEVLRRPISVVGLRSK